MSVLSDPTGDRPTSPSSTLSQPASPWKTISSVKMNDLYTVSKYRSLVTGMELVHAKVDGPHIHCYWVIGHKLEDDLGVPHVLKNMIWHGSKHFPFPSLFERISKKCYTAAGPKAWAEKDHSSYYITTAGKQAFKALVPVVFDHIFNPLLQEPSFVTEVYHIEGDGSEHGPCLEECMRLERDPDELTTQELIRLAFGAESSYWYNYSGTWQSFRNSECTLDMVKQFHEKFYHPANCCLVIVGDVVKDDLLSTLDPIMQTLAQEKASKIKDWVKPWLAEPLVEITEPRMKRVEYPSDQPNVYRTAGSVKVGIVGPPSSEKLNRCVAMRLVLEYLTTGPIIKSFASKRTRSSISSASLSPNAIQSAREGVFLATNVHVSEYELKQSLFILEFHNVPIEMISAVPHILRRSIEEHLNWDFDLERMIQIVNRFYQEELGGMENFVQDKIVHAVIPDFLYSAEDSDLMFDRRINSAYTIHHFLNQSEDFWKQLIETSFLSQYWATVGSVPSQQLYENFEEELKSKRDSRIMSANIRETKKFAQKYKAASKLVNKMPPSEILNKFPLPAVDSIGFINISRQDNPTWAKDTLCNLYVDDVNSNYVFLTIIMDTSELTLEEKKYLVLFAEGILHSPYVDHSDVFHSAQDVEQAMSRDLLRCETFFGLEWLGNLEDRTRFSCGSYPHLFCLRLQMEIEKVKEGFSLAHFLLWNTRWQADELQQVAIRLVREVDLNLKYQGSVMTRAMLTDSLYLMNSIPKTVSLIRQKQFLRKMAEELPKSMRKVSKMLDKIRMTILRPENVTVHVAASVARMEFFLTEDPNARDAVAQLFHHTFDYTGWNWGYDTKRLSNTADMYWMRSPDCIAKCSKEQILRMEDTDVGHLIQAAPGPRSYQDPDYPLLLVALQYFIQPGSGPLYKELIESGLAKEVDIRVSPSEGVIYFEMRVCPNLAATYGKAFDIIAKHVGETRQDQESVMTALAREEIWDEFLLSSAKSSMVFRLTQEENTPTHMAMTSLLAYYKNLQLNSSRQLMDNIVNATLREVQVTTIKYFRPLFLQPCTCAASAPKEQCIPIMKELMEHCGKRLTLIPPVEQSALASYNQ